MGNFDNGISVIMPTYKQAQYIRRAIVSLINQTYNHWELIIINDGSPDETEAVVQEYQSNLNIKYLKNDENKGLGYCLNMGLASASREFIAYLPSDDIFFRDHLASLRKLLGSNQNAIAAYSKYRSNFFAELYESDSYLNNENLPVQLCQVLHRRTDLRWIERDELVTDDLRVMFFDALTADNEVVRSEKMTAEWINHPEQRSKIIHERTGGIYRYKSYYNVRMPIRYQSSFGSMIDEESLYKGYRFNAIETPTEGLKILLVGELAYNAERICSLEQKGHKLYGLWVDKPAFLNAVGPLAFGNITDIPLNDWKTKVKEIKPDIIYGLLNVSAITLADSVLRENLGIPFVWHFKEGPEHAMKYGFWKELINLYSKCDGQIFTNLETREWFSQFLPAAEVPSFILDGDIPSQKWFTDDRSNLLSDQDGEFHTVISGRPVGFSLDGLKVLSDQKIHVHLYGELNENFYKDAVQAAGKLTARFHVHPNCGKIDWVKEFSKYDAGWLHLFDSHNEGDLMKANWHDLNFPARIPTLAAAGIPMLQKDNSGHVVATQRLSKDLNTGLYFEDLEQVGSLLGNKTLVNEIRQSTFGNRAKFTFDYYVDDLVQFFKDVIASKNNIKL